MRWILEVEGITVFPFVLVSENVLNCKQFCRKVIFFFFSFFVCNIENSVKNIYFRVWLVMENRKIFFAFLYNMRS
jgi:hypothetical protein